MKQVSKRELAAQRSLTRRSFARFRRDEDGGMIIFALFMFILMLMAGGMAVDFMRFETTRTKLQGTIDRAVLAAADMDQELSPAAVVQDYFAKSGMTPFLTGTPLVEEGLNYRRVSAEAQATMTMLFADLMLIFTDPDMVPFRSTIVAPAVSAAEERVTNVEVSLVVDVSGSMSSNNRFYNMQQAAYEFIDTIMANNGIPEEGLMSMSIVAYSSVVNLGSAVAPYYNIDTLHEYSNCVLLPDSVFASTALPMGGHGVAGTTPYTQVSHYEQWYDYSLGETLYEPICFAGEENAVIVHSTSADDLKGMIESLDVYGNTAIDLGMKWGTAFLDPGTRPLVTGLIGSNDVQDVVLGRPMNFGLSDNLKVIVLMTDGQNTTEYDLEEPYKSGMSPIWFDRDGSWESIGDVSYNDMSILIDDDGSPNDFSDDTFFWLDQPYWNRFHHYPKGYPDYVDDGPNGLNIGVGQGVAYPNDVHHASWQDIYANWSLSRIDDVFFREAYYRYAISYYDYKIASYADYPVVSGYEADERLSDICEEARNSNIVVYTVAFEAPSGGQDALRDCATSVNTYFSASGTDISAVFAAIASDIRSLKLIQ